RRLITAWGCVSMDTIWPRKWGHRKVAMRTPGTRRPGLTLDEARLWHVLDEADLAKLRCALMRELAWIDWDQRPPSWWQKEHATLLTVKRACLVPRHGTQEAVCGG